MRYSNTERLGVIETDKIVTKDLGWIFREQSVIDVGLDAIIEECIDGSPTGKFIAVQIKSGLGNFYLSDKNLIYYVSNIHYNYWLNLSIPIILVAHIPEEEETYWQQISIHNFKKTKKKWKLEIPLKQKFNKNSKTRLTKILSDINDKSYVFKVYKGKTEPDDIYDFVENINCISESTQSLSNMNIIIEEMSKTARLYTEKFKSFNDNKLSDQDDQVKASIKAYGRTINISSKRLENEIVIFSELYSEGLNAFENLIVNYYLMTDNSEVLQTGLESILNIPESIDSALNGIQQMKIGVLGLSNKYAVLKEAKNQFLEVIDLQIFELLDSKVISEKIILKLNKLILN